MDYSRAAYRTVVAELLCDALDALGVDRACGVGGSIGNLWALRLAQTHPARVYGTADPVGSVETWRRFVGGMPGGELEVVDGGGHLVWYDDPGRIGARVARFLAG